MTTTEIAPQTETAVECYLLHYGRTYLEATPAKVVRETTQTITVAATRPDGSASEWTFQKEKEYGGGYRNPRDVRPHAYGFDALCERGSKFGNYRLSFDVNRVRARLEAERPAREADKLRRRVFEKMRAFMATNERNYAEEAVAKLAAIEAAIDSAS